ncbi:MAG: nitroreductase [Bacteroidales bacterium]|nr:nitroreductase [Bacteroidales bacterium]
MTLQEAIVARHSVRQYIDKPIEAEIINRLNDEIADCNRDGKLHIQLVTDEPRAFAGGMAKYGKFRGVSNYLAMVGPKGADEAIGWYGERLVLLAQTLGLNSCWVGVSFKKQPDQYTIADGEKLHCVISLGYGANQGVQHHMQSTDWFVVVNGSNMRRQRDVILPDWFKRGMEAALLAPTAVNQQKFEFELVDDHTVTARTRFSLIGYAKMDLGIAKYHFEVAAGKENFKWGEF